MRTKDKLIELLKNELNSPIWQNLKRAILGNELINYGATLLYNNEIAYDTFYRNLFSDTADLKGCIHLGKAYEEPFCDFYPAYIKLKLPAENYKVYPPFSIVLTAGSVKFTNIEHVKNDHYGEKVVTLYQGNVMCATLWGAPVLGFKNVLTRSLEFFKVDADPDENQVYIKLAKKVIPESVYAFRTKDKILPYTLMNPLNENPTTYNYRLMKGNDGFLNMYFSDGVRGRAYDSHPIAVFYLESTFNKYKNVQRVLQTDSLGEIPIYDADVISEFSGNEESIVAARATLKANLAKGSVIATKDQIRVCANSHPNVIDSNVVASEEVNKVLVYVKPRAAGDTYEDIKEELRIHGELVTSYDVREGTSVGVTIRLRTIEEGISEETKSQVVDSLRNDLAYEKLPYKSTISLGNLATSISEMTEYGVDVTISVSSVITLDYTRLVLRPQRGTIRIVNAEGEVVGWDSEGYLYGYTEIGEIQLDNILKFGDFFLNTNTGDSITTIYDKTLSKKVTANASDVRFGEVVRYLKRKDRIVVQTTSGGSDVYRVFEEGRIFIDGEYSVLRTSRPVVSALYPPNSSGYISCTTSDLLSDSIMLDSGILKFENLEGKWTSSLFQLSPDGNTWQKTYLLNYATGVDYTVSIIGFVTYGSYVAVIFEDITAIAINVLESGASSIRAITNANSALGVAGQEIIKLGKEESFFMITSKIVDGGEIQTVWWAPNCSIVYGASAYLTIAGDLIEAYVSAPNQNLEVLEASRQGVYIKAENRVVYWSAQGLSVLGNEGDFISELAYSGTVSYDQKTINLENAEAFLNMDLEFESVEPLFYMADSEYPVISQIEWV